jgi:hypothetical protein
MNLKHFGAIVPVLVVLQLPAEAQHIPREIESYAERLEAECTRFKDVLPEEGGRSKIISVAADREFGRIFVADGSQTACGESGPFCGTGGCDIGIFRSRGGITSILYDQQALGWELNPSGSSIELIVHGSRCGGSGPDACITEITLLNGRARTYKPGSRR